VLCLAAAGAVALALTACGGTSASSGVAGSGKQLTIGFAPGIASDPYTSVTDQSYLTSAITGDSGDGGRQAARTLAAQIGDAGQVFIMNSSPTATTNQLRAKGSSSARSTPTASRQRRPPR